MTVRRLADGSWESVARREASEDMNIPKMLHRRAREHPGQVAVERRSPVGDWRPVTIDEFLAEADTMARGLVGLGLEAGEHLAILAPTSYEWALLDIAALSCGAITVPIYETDSASQIAHILADADVKIVITATSQQADLVESVRTDGVRMVLALDRGAERLLSQTALDVPLDRVRSRTDGVGLRDEATVIYTSGTTGMPKGVVLTHANFIETMLQAYDILPNVVQRVEQPDVLIFEGLNVLQTWGAERGAGAPRASVTVSDFFDFSIYVDAEESDIERWYQRRFLSLQQTVFRRPDSYFHHYRDLTEAEALQMASDIWREINLRNLRENIAPTRERANLVVRKQADHRVGEILLRMI